MISPSHLARVGLIHRRSFACPDSLRRADTPQLDVNFRPRHLALPIQ